MREWLGVKRIEVYKGSVPCEQESGLDGSEFGMRERFLPSIEMTLEAFSSGMLVWVVLDFFP